MPETTTNSAVWWVLGLIVAAVVLWAVWAAMNPAVPSVPNTGTVNGTNMTQPAQ